MSSADTRKKPSEPVRGNLYIAAVAVGLASVFGILAASNPITAQAVFLAVSVGLGEVAAIAFGVERARRRVTPLSPEGE